MIVGNNCSLLNMNQSSFFASKIENCIGKSWNGIIIKVFHLRHNDFGNVVCIGKIGSLSIQSYIAKFSRGGTTCGLGTTLWKLTVLMKALYIFKFLLNSEKMLYIFSYSFSSLRFLMKVLLPWYRWNALLPSLFSFISSGTSSLMFNVSIANKNKRISSIFIYLNML